MKFPFESLAVIHKVRTFASAFEGQALVERKFFDRLAQVRDGAPRVSRVVWRGCCSVAGAALKVIF